MRLKLKEDPREWRKFAWAGSAIFAIATLFAWRRGRLPAGTAEWILLLLGGIALLALVKPRWFRPAYRAAMTASFHVGQVMGRVLLSILFLCLLTPLALLFRLMGKDPLKLRRDPNARTYWQKAKPPGDLERQF